MSQGYRVLVVCNGDPAAELAIGRLRESPAVGWCQPAPRRPRAAEGAHALAGLMEGEKVDTVVYFPSLSARRGPKIDLGHAEFSLTQSVRAKVRRIIIVSSASAYAPHWANPGLISEARAATFKGRDLTSGRWLEFESLAEKHAGGGNSVELTILRPATVLSRGDAQFFVSLFKSRLAFTLAGYDPNIQLLSPGDLADAVCRVVERGGGGVYNVAPAGVISLRMALGAAGARRVPVPRSLQRIVRSMLAPAGLAEPVEQMDRIRWSWAVSGGRIRREVGFEPELKSAEALAEFLRAGGVRRGTRLGEAVGREFDDFGMDKNYIAALGRTLFKFLHRYYWRVEVDGLENVPREGRAVLVGIHRGIMPWDGVMVLHSLVQKLGRHPRFLIHPGLLKFPHLSTFMTRLGGLVACQENADYVLERDHLLGIFPEGIRGAYTLYRDGYRLGSFGRSDFVRIAKRNRAPIVPFVVVGSAEVFPIIKKIEWGWWRRFSEAPVFPVVPLPLPLPSKWHIRFLPPLRVEDRYRPDDAAAVRDLSREVRGRIQEATDLILSRRKSIFFGSVL